jgi:ATP-dependent Clp protease ATP-binding subunit ClpA
MFERARSDTRAVLQEARDDAQRSGSPTLEAEHLLLALSAHPDPAAGRLLGEAGLDPSAIRRALDAQSERSLAMVGVDASVFRLPAPPARARAPRWGASSKRAIERAVGVTRERRARYLQPTHLLIGVLTAQEGTVPRALALTGIDREDLLQRATAGLGRVS